jgi:putative heme-binding domain-containing protein
LNCTIVIAALLYMGGGAAVRAQQALPDGTGRAEFQRICAACHGLDLATKLRMSEDAWGGLVNEMVTIGALGTDEEFSRVVKYLGANFGPGNAPATTGPAGAGAAASAGARSRGGRGGGAGGGQAVAAMPAPPPGDAAKGMALFESKGCVMCHRVGDKGSHLGPNLTDIGARRDPARLVTAIRDPDAEVLPENRFVNVVLKDGRSVRGRLLNHDALSVQLIDAKEQLRTFTIQQMRSYTILEKGLMPPETSLSDQEVADIVNYLASLKGNGN